MALKMAERGLVSAPNMAAGEPFNVGITAAQLTPMPGVTGLGDGSTGAHAAHAGP